MATTTAAAAAAAARGPASSLSDVDTIMEPDVLSRLKAFISTGPGSQSERVKEAIRLLSTSYKGRAQMCNLLIRWIVDIMGEPEEVPPGVVAPHACGNISVTSSK